MYLVAISKPHQEAYAARQLENQGAQCYVPVCLKDVSQKSQSHYSPLLARYFMFAPQGLAIRKVLNTRGVSGIVKHGDGTPAQVSKKDFEWWLSMTAVVQDMRRKTAQYMIGQTVAVSEGPFAGLLGELIGFSGQKLKLQLPESQNSLILTVGKDAVSSSFAA
jgi:transcription antitermination factor NusG